MEFHVFDHLCGDLEKFGSVSFLDASAYEQLNVILTRTSVSRATRGRETCCWLKSVVHGLKEKREIKVQEFDLVRVERKCSSQKMSYVWLQVIGLKWNWKNMYWRIWVEIMRSFESDIAAIEKLQKNISKDVFQKFAGLTRERSKEMMWAGWEMWR